MTRRAGPPKAPAGEHVAEVESLAQTGEGVARVGGARVLVPGALPGERVRIRVARGDDVAEVRAVEVASPARVPAPCGVFDQCGGCTWQHAPAELQRDARLAQLRRALPRSLADVAVDYVPSPASYGYRARARLAWTSDASGVRLGFRARSRHDVVDAPSCPVLVPALDAALGALRDELAALPGGGEVGLALGAGARPVANVRPSRMPDARGFEVPARLVARGFAGAALWAPGATAPEAAGDPRPVTRGGDGAELYLAPEGFAQANEALNVALAARVEALARPAGATVLELYAGAGNFTVVLARSARRVVAVESDRGAADALAANVAARRLENVTVVRDDAARVAASRSADVVVLDPPRTGAREACEAIARALPKRAVYVSCDPPTLGRDLGVLAAGMDVATVAAFEMFPQTPHLEVVVALERRRAR